jgi:hypothetical protein
VWQQRLDEKSASLDVARLEMGSLTREYDVN